MFPLRTKYSLDFEHFAFAGLHVLVIYFGHEYMSNVKECAISIIALERYMTFCKKNYSIIYVLYIVVNLIRDDKDMDNLCSEKKRSKYIHFEF